MGRAVEVERTRLAEASAGIERRAGDLERLIGDYVSEQTRVSQQSTEHKGIAQSSTEEAEKIAEKSSEVASSILHTSASQVGARRYVLHQGGDLR